MGIHGDSSKLHGLRCVAAGKRSGMALEERQVSPHYISLQDGLERVAPAPSARPEWKVDSGAALAAVDGVGQVGTALHPNCCCGRWWRVDSHSARALPL